MTPQERSEKLEKFSKAYDELKAFVNTLTDEEMNFKPAPEKWSGHEIIVHIADSEANAYTRVRKAIAEPGGMVFGYDQDVWTQKLDYQKLDWRPYLELFGLLRKTTYDLVKNLPAEKWEASQYNHSEYGPAGLDRWLDIYTAHVPNHIEQIKRNIAQMTR